MVVVAQQLVRAQHQLPKVDHALTQALRFVEFVQLHLAAGFIVTHRHISRALAVFLAPGNEVLNLLGRKAVFVHIELLAQPLDGRQLVLRVQNLKGLRQTGQLVMRPQKAVAQAVKGANPHGVHIDRQHGLQTQFHLFGGFVGEGHGQNAARRHLPGLQQPGDAGGQYPCFAGACAGQNQGVLRGQDHRPVLLVVELGEQRRRRSVGGWFRQHALIVGSSNRFLRLAQPASFVCPARPVFRPLRDTVGGHGVPPCNNVNAPRMSHQIPMTPPPCTEPERHEGWHSASSLDWRCTPPRAAE